MVVNISRQISTLKKNIYMLLNVMWCFLLCSFSMKFKIFWLGNVEPEERKFLPKWSVTGLQLV